MKFLDTALNVARLVGMGAELNDAVRGYKKDKSALQANHARRMRQMETNALREEVKRQREQLAFNRAMKLAEVKRNMEREIDNHRREQIRLNMERLHREADVLLAQARMQDPSL